MQGAVLYLDQWNSGVGLQILCDSQLAAALINGCAHPETPDLQTITHEVIVQLDVLAFHGVVPQ